MRTVNKGGNQVVVIILMTNLRVLYSPGEFLMMTRKIPSLPSARKQEREEQIPK